MTRFEIKKYKHKEVESYWLNEKLHRGDGPALVERFATGYVFESYYQHGRLHRQEGPARILRRPDGSTYEYAYYRNGKLHRQEGPALIYLHEDGSRGEFYYQDGARVEAARPSQQSGADRFHRRSAVPG